MIELRVDLGDRGYPVVVGAGARHRLLEHLPLGAKRAAIVTQDGIGVEVDPGIEHRLTLAPAPGAEAADAVAVSAVNMNGRVTITIA